MEKLTNDLVSIIMPAYNAENFISEAINCLQKQTYPFWELVVVDDCSTDGTKNIIQKTAEIDKRIKYHALESNSGAAVARNTAIENAKGAYIAFLDSDDLWESNKLEKQVRFMQENNLYFTCTYYGKIDENSNNLNNIITYKEIADYDELLRNCPGNSTVIYNAKILGKFYIPNIRKRNDYVMWLQVIKKSHQLHCLPEVLSYHRISSSSLSSNKKSLVAYHWKVYREIEKLSIVKSVKLLMYWISKGIVRGKSER
ncbi:glycosyltransferase family 2 protein [Streptococcus pluranimalium]